MAHKNIFYRDDKGFYHDIVKYHTRQKHKFIEEYLKIWINNVGGEHKPTLDIFDLFASTGLCYCKDNKESWGGTAKLAADCLNAYERGRYLYLNSYNDNPDYAKMQVGNLINLVGSSSDNKYEPLISSEPINEAVDTAIHFAAANNVFQYPNIWMLDPHAASDLPWEVVEKIASQKRYYQKKGKETCRKPELIITLMTHDLQRNIDEHPQVLSTAFGMREETWRPLIQKQLDEGQNKREAVIHLYSQRLSNLYEKPPIIIDVKATDGTAVVYCLLLCTDNDAGHYVTKLHSLPDFKEWLISEWGNNAKQIVAEKGLSEKQSKLDVFL